MKVILISDVEHVGSYGEIKEVKSGFARNYLLPRKLALELSEHNKALVEKKKKKIEQQREIEKLSAQEQKQKLEELVINFKRKSGDNEVLFGSVNAGDIAEELENRGMKIEKKKIHLSEPIKRIGHYSCQIKLHNEVTAEIKIEVEALEE